MWRLLPPDTRKLPPRARPLRRRGVTHGFLVAEPDGPAASDPTPPSAAWEAAEPLALPGALADSLPAARPWIEQSLALFEHLRAGGRFFDAVLAILEDHPEFRPEGSTVDLLDPREIEKVFVSGLHAADPRARGGPEVWAKLGWIAHDRADASLRVRFSCGTEQLHDWHEDIAGQEWADRFAEAVFPEGLALARDDALLDLVGGLLGGPVRLSERIVYSNATGGGAVFHHDADPTQRGVAYAQLAGETAWLALPRAELLAQIAAHARTASGPLPSTRLAAAAALDRTDEPALYRLLNEDPAFTARLADAGWLMVLEPGDVLLLPSHDAERCAWHSVFALGEHSSLAHSYGIFRRGP